MCSITAVALSSLIRAADLAMNFSGLSLNCLNIESYIPVKMVANALRVSPVFSTGFPMRAYFTLELVVMFTLYCSDFSFTKDEPEMSDFFDLMFSILSI